MKKILIVGDRVLIKLDNPEDRTKVGLYLPQTVIDKQQVQSGTIVKTGPGIAIPDIIGEDEEPWQHNKKRTRYIPMQAEAGDHVLFLKRDAFEIKYDGEDYLVVPQAALLVLIREIDETEYIEEIHPPIPEIGEPF